MAIGASILRGEIRRHLLMNVGLVASCVVGATVVTNERGLFVPITVDMSDTSRAFAAMFTQSHLLPDHEITNVQMVTPLAPFEVTADSRDLRRRLMDALATSNDPTGADGLPGSQSEYAQNASQVPTLDNQVLSLNGPSGGSTAGGGSGSSGGTSGGTQAAAAGPTVASATAPTSSTSTTNPTPLTVANTNNTAQQQSASGVSDGSALTSDGGSSLGNSTGTDQSAGPAAVPEPSAWAMLIAGFGMIGFLLRSRRKTDIPADEKSIG